MNEVNIFNIYSQKIVSVERNPNKDIWELYFRPIQGSTESFYKCATKNNMLDLTLAQLNWIERNLVDNGPLNIYETIAINIDPVVLIDLLDDVTSLCKLALTKGTRVVVEVTERSRELNSSRLLSAIGYLKLNSISVALDDLELNELKLVPLYSDIITYVKIKELDLIEALEVYQRKKLPIPIPTQTKLIVENVNCFLASSYSSYVNVSHLQSFIFSNPSKICGNQLRVTIFND